MKGILLCGHGTRVQVGESAFKAFAEKFTSTITGYEVEYGFLELSQPDFEQGVSKLKAKGIEEIIAVPVFLFNGVHIASDIPNMLHQLQEKHHVSIKLANYIGVCQEMVDLSLDLIRKSISDDDMSDTAFFPIGIGASMADSNGDMFKLSRLAQEELKMPFMINAFTSRMTFPSVDKALAVLDQLSFKRIIALPYIFFPGVYLDNAIRSIEGFKLKHPEKEFILCPKIGESDKLIDILMLRLKEVEEGGIDLIESRDPSACSHHHHHGHDHGDHHHGHSHDHEHHH